MTYPLTGIKIVALEQAVAAPLASRHLADLGADVIKIERPNHGDFARRYDGSVHGVSSYFTWLNRSKRSLTLNIKQAQGIEIIKKLLDNSDIFLTNLSQSALDRAGLNSDKVRANRSNLIYCSISGYGSDGPFRDRKAYDMLLQGESGILESTGTEDQPAKVGISLCDIAAGMYAAMAILGAILIKQNTGEGTTIDIAMLEAAAEWMGSPLYYYLGSHEKLRRTGMRHNLIVPYGSYRCGDGKFVNLSIQNESEWKSFCEIVLKQPELSDDPRFRSNELRFSNREIVESIIESSFSGSTRSELILELDLAGIAWGNVNDVEELANHPQLQARNRWLPGTVLGKPFDMLKHPMNIDGMLQRMEPVPGLGQHSADILKDLGYDDGDILNLKQLDVI